MIAWHEETIDRMKAGLTSFLVSIPALACALGARHAAEVRIPGSGHVLAWMQEHGLVRDPDPGRTPEWAPASLTLLTDGSAIQWLLLHSWWFGGAAMLMALRADRKREETLYSAAGYVCGALALSLSAPAVALGAALSGMAILGIFRSKGRPVQLDGNNR